MSTVSPSESSRLKNSEHISLTWPDDYVSVDPGDFFQEESNDPDWSDKKKRILFRPQVTVNVFNTGDSNSNAGGSGAGGAAPVYNNGSGHGDNGGEDAVPNFATQLAALTKKVDQLASAKTTPIIDSGAWNTMEVRPWNRPESSTQARINFIEKFASVPMVAVSLNMADVQHSSNFRVKVYATAVDVNGFTIKAESWSDTTLYCCGVTWIAIGTR
ncbi:uncharacterized protein GGS22DRAFT_162192 [Annulohypoxylon maeteangense]|uniref:uncharacterized protein n=1 Tax=Annulohypoxylon maeteangense TaxID=1927788 RepID=UPI0020078361|nr:uncharacterized protein GGS22DRAFT_162192 [Annulohypoxylon maeteangense]KAI0885878.1 hypothetical protein GGS22DRAFT_162192 [Annulohypoxylon maeteangense]